MKMIKIACAVGCGRTDTVPARETDKKPGVPVRVVPVQAHPYVCLSCWRNSWRSVMRDDGSWVVRNADHTEVDASDWDKDVTDAS